jgi:2-octaprenyl-6-methoxyphenol hydroxylase
MTEEFDCVVVGGGPVGAAAALELAHADLRVMLIEAREGPAASNEARPRALSPFSEMRPLALSYGSRLILERLGVWEALAEASPIERIHISQRGRFGRTVMTAADAGFPALGYVLDYGTLVSALDSAISASGLPTLRGGRVTSIAHDAASARIEFETSEGPGECLASVVVVADGTAEAAGIDARVVDYGQSALSARVETAMHHVNTAYERFTPEGPLALLPRRGGYAVVWTTTPERAQRLCDAAPDTFLAELQAHFGERAGRFDAVGARATHRVALRLAESVACGRAVLIGNSAQALHPVAGQGFNVGLRDAWELAVEIRKRGPRDEAVLRDYSARRRVDRTGAVAFTHALVKLFSNDSLPLGIARGAGLTLLDCFPPAKDFVVRRMVFGSRG